MLTDLTGARILTPDKEIGAAPWGWRAGGGFTPEDARLARIVFKVVAR